MMRYFIEYVILSLVALPCFAYALNSNNTDYCFRIIVVLILWGSYYLIRGIEKEDEKRKRW